MISEEENCQMVVTEVTEEEINNAISSIASIFTVVNIYKNNVIYLIWFSVVLYKYLYIHILKCVSLNHMLFFFFSLQR